MKIMAMDATTRPLKVLVIDGDVDAAQSLALLLELYKHTACVAYNGPQAFWLAHEFRPNLVILDIGLPGISGYEVARTFRDDVRLGQPRVIALSGWSEDKTRSEQAGLAAHLVKSIDPAELVARLHRHAAADDAALPPNS
jgi:DNA-binding response OmpR family regulator